MPGAFRPFAYYEIPPKGQPGAYARHPFPGSHAVVMQSHGFQDKSHYGDDLAADQGQYNRPIIRPATSRFRLNRRMDLVAPNVKTPWPTVNWLPNPPHRVHQVLRSGGLQPIAPGMLTVQRMQYSGPVYNQASGGLSGITAAIRAALGMGG